MCPRRGTRAHPSTWGPPRACACSSEYATCLEAWPSWLQGPSVPQHRVDPTCLLCQSWASAPQQQDHSPWEGCSIESFLCHSLTSPEASANVLTAVTRTLTQYPFDFRGARILSGQDEGVFGWVTANYLLENFIKVGLAASPVSQWAWHPQLTNTSFYPLQYGWVGRWFRPRKGTLGAMDLGGASTQITFETASPAEDPANEVQLRLYGQHYRVYTHSFLCYGRDQVLRRLLASALQVPPRPLCSLGG